jgi:hypothetical protein
VEQQSDGRGGVDGPPAEAEPEPAVDPIRASDLVRAAESEAHLSPGAGTDGDGTDLREAEHQAHRIAGAVYGTILATTVVAALGHDPKQIDAAIAIVLFTSAVFYAAHVYSLIIAARMVARRRLTRTEMRAIAAGEWPMLQSSLPVVAPLLLGTLGIIDKDAASYISVCVGIGALFVYGVLMGVQEGKGRISVLWNALVVGSFGILILLLKIFVH